ncbi:hypothetical protein SPBR_02920 [Sporothrix brasiliensis 5110]|uniref:Alpha/beta hydrolase fold-3 domain-containing protein n=1 Tax=Sporothrix brasiliensis 5110 TaxID=1398154 RepID=A0A0C2IUN2_9PEZI|nr:uncharacterized protein SPBR_02920 [Sporothrix brasiliensis 5110]KIH92866.1 hypothetical protein SPBR_02920 [Sporothrix brasiliensis 5110]
MTNITASGTDGTAPINPLHPSVEGCVDDKVKEIYNEYQANRLRADQVSYDEFNADRQRYVFPREKVAAPFCPVGLVTTHRVPVTEPEGSIDVRFYRPEGFDEADGKKLPLYINFHGGGFVLGGLDDDDSMLRRICKRTPCLVANVAYRLAPEFPHPVPATDSWAALKWLVDHSDELGIDKYLIAVGGLSAGGCLAAVLAQMAAMDPTMPRLTLQVLIVPVTDARYVPLVAPKDDAELSTLRAPYDSYYDFAFAPMLPLARLAWFYRLWLGEDPDTHAKNAADVRASPIVAPDNVLRMVCAASIHVAEIDPLASEASAYHHRLLDIGRWSELISYKGMVHPFAQWDGALPQSQELLANVVQALKCGFFWGYPICNPEE